MIEKGIRKNSKRSRGGSSHGSPEAVLTAFPHSCLFFPGKTGPLRILPIPVSDLSQEGAASPVWAALPHSRRSGLPLEWEQERGSAPAWAHGSSCARCSQSAPKALKRESFGFRVSAPVWDTEPNSLNKEKKKKKKIKEKKQEPRKALWFLHFRAPVQFGSENNPRGFDPD